MTGEIQCNQAVSPTTNVDLPIETENENIFQLISQSMQALKCVLEIGLKLHTQRSFELLTLRCCSAILLLTKTRFNFMSENWCP